MNGSTTAHLINSKQIKENEVCYASKKSFPGGAVIKNPPTNAGDMDLIPGSGTSPGGGHGNPPQYSCLENPIDKRSLMGYGP